MPKVINKKKRKFKVTTPGQIRDFEILVKNRRFQKYEEVTPQEEDAPANSVAGGGVDMAPNAGPRKPKVFLKRKRLERVDGRSKAYRQTVKRIKERQVRKQQKEVEQRFSQFAVQANPFREETDMSNKKYLETKDSSLEAAVNHSVQTEVLRPHDDKPTLTLPKNRYLEAKENSVEYAAMKAIVEGQETVDEIVAVSTALRAAKPKPKPAARPGAPKPAARPGAPKPAATKPKPAGPALPRQLKDPKKEKMGGTKSGTKVVDRGDPKYKGAPEHESVVRENGDHPDMGDHDEKDEFKGKLKGRKSFKQFQKKDKENQDEDPVGKKQDDLDKDDEAQATRSKKRPTAESDKPEQGKVYALTGKSNEPSIARGDSWKKSVMKKPASGVKDHKWKPKKEGTEGEALVKAVANSTKQQALKKKQAAQDAYQKNIDYDTARHAAKTRKHEEIEVEEMSPLMQATIAELSKKTLGSYVKKASVDKSNATLDLGISQGPKQTRADVVKHAGKAIKRQKGIDKAVDKLSKEEKDSRRTDDAIDAYDKSKDASRDADWDTTHGKKGKGDKEKKYAKKERGEIDKDDPNWKHKKGHTGMHGESKESETGERDVGSSQYLKYTTSLTPGQGITSDQAKKADVAKKIEQQRQRTTATGIDDAHVPGHRADKPAIGMKALKQKFKANRTAVRQKQARQAIKTTKKEEMDLDAIIAKKLPESAVNPMGAPSNAPIGRSVIGDTAPEKVSPVKGSVTSQASPSGSVPGESGIEKVMDKINRIVKSGHSEKIHDKVIDKDTASAIQSTYAKVNAANQEKMEKVMSKDAAAMEKVSKFSKKNA